MFALVISHLYYSSILMCSQNLLIRVEKQLSWAVKSCFNRKKYDRSTDLKLKYKVLPVHIFNDFKVSCYFWKIITNNLPAHTELSHPNSTLIYSERKCHYFTDFRWISDYLKIVSLGVPPLCGII